jgi:hypothetical protein
LILVDPFTWIHCSSLCYSICISFVKFFSTSLKPNNHSLTCHISYFLLFPPLLWSYQFSLPFRSLSATDAPHLSLLSMGEAKTRGPSMHQTLTTPHQGGLLSEAGKRVSLAQPGISTAKQSTQHKVSV